jgi:hypothetical protein
MNYEPFRKNILDWLAKQPDSAFPLEIGYRGISLELGVHATQASVYGSMLAIEFKGFMSWNRGILRVERKPTQAELSKAISREAQLESLSRERGKMLNEIRDFINNKAEKLDKRTILDRINEILKQDGSLYSTEDS